MIKYIARRLSEQKGQTLLEFAFVAPVLLVFLLAIVDFGIAIDRRIVLQHAVREGTRYAAVGGSAFTTGDVASEADIEDYVVRQSQGIAETVGSYVDVCYDDENGNGIVGDVGDNVRVQAHYVHDFVTGFTGFLNMGAFSITMEPSASARVELDSVGGTACLP